MKSLDGRLECFYGELAFPQLMLVGNLPEYEEGLK